MYKAIYDYALEHNKVVKQNRRKVEIAGYIILSEEGKYERVEIIPKKNRKEVICPYTGEFYQSSMSNPICEKLKYILPTSEAVNMSPKQPQYHKTWLNIMKESTICGEALRAIYSFILELESDKGLEKNFRSDLARTSIKEGDCITFQVGDFNVVESQIWEKWFDEYMIQKRNSQKSEDSLYVISSLSGQKIRPISGKEKFPAIEVGQITGTGCSIASFAENSYRSYGINGSLNTPMSKEEADTIKAGIEFLLNSENNHSNDFSLLYWYSGEGENMPDLVGRALKRNIFQEKLKKRSKKDKLAESRDKSYHDVLDSVFKGIVRQNINSNGKYHIIQYVTPTGRIFFTNERIGTYRELYDNLHLWYKDSMINYPTQATQTLYSIHDILIELIDHKKDKADEAWKEVKNEFGEDVNRLLDAIFQGDQIPRRMYHHALSRFTQSVIEGRFTSEGNERDQPTRIPLQIIKTYLIREGKDMDVTLNQNSTNVAYQCGRWLAAMDQLQKRSANGKIGVTLGQKFYRAAKRQPAKILTMVTDYKEIYLGRISNEGLRIYFEKLLGEISEKIGERFPENFSIADQGAFDMGYAQQHQSFFSKGSNVENTEDESEEED